MEAVQHGILQKLRQQPCLLQIFQLIRRAEGTCLHTAVQRRLGMQKQGEIGDGHRPRLIEEGRRGPGVLLPPARPGNAGHDVGSILHAHGLNPGDLGLCLGGIVILVHKGQHIVQPRLHPQIQPLYPQIRQLLQLGIAFLGDAGDGGVHVHPLTIRKALPDSGEDFHQMVIGQLEGAAVPQEDGFGVSPHVPNPVQLRLYLRQGQNPVGQVFEQRTEFTTIVAAAHGHRQHKRSPFHRCTADLTLVFHGIPPLFIAPPPAAAPWQGGAAAPAAFFRFYGHRSQGR